MALASRRPRNFALLCNRRYLHKYILYNVPRVYDGVIYSTFTRGKWMQRDKKEEKNVLKRKWAVVCAGDASRVALIKMPLFSDYTTRQSILLKYNQKCGRPEEMKWFLWFYTSFMHRKGIIKFLKYLISYSLRLCLFDDHIRSGQHNIFAPDKNIKW